jgi:hypothetical protein
MNDCRADSWSSSLPGFRSLPYLSVPFCTLPQPPLFLRSSGVALQVSVDREFEDDGRTCYGGGLGINPSGGNVYKGLVRV